MAALTVPDITAYREYISSALSYGHEAHTVDDVCALVAAGDAQFWPGPHSVLITEVVTAPLCKTLHIWLAAGKDIELSAMLPGVIDWGRTQGCTRASLIGRKGWERAPHLVATGWTKSDLIMMHRDIA